MGWRERTSPKRAWREAVGVSCFFVVLGLYLLILSIHHHFFQWTRNDFAEYTGVLKYSPQFERSRSGPILKMVFREANQFEFTIQGDNYKVLKQKNGIEKLHAGDSVSVLVDKNDFNAKIKRSQAPTYGQRIINWNWLSVYEFKHDDQVFLSFDEVIRELKSSSKIAFVVSLICFVGTYFYVRREYRIYSKAKIIS
nr:hypothetical protein [uncultured Fluviicola sp.]